MYLAIIPAFNEEKSIGTVIQETKKYVDKIIIVDDHSTDNTCKIARRSGAIVICHSTNKGVGAAIRTGIFYAKRLKPEVVIIMDADGQHRPKDIPRLMQPIIDGNADVVLGSRFLHRQPMNMSMLKIIGNRFLSFITSILTGIKLTDTQSGFRCLNRKALSVLKLYSDFTYTQEMILNLCHKGLRCVEVPIQAIPRKYGKSKVVSKISVYAFKVLIILFSTYLRLKTCE
ncbi:MAG: glycosyltransferase family 2 protein [Candidatus Heimdallarchaeaceae archaeon]